MLHWLLEAGVLKELEQARIAGIAPTAEQREMLDARIMGIDSDDQPRILTIAGNVAEITIKGILTNAPDFFAIIFGGGNTTYGEIISALAVAEQDDDVTEIILAIDSPGGEVAGMFDALAALEAAKKPIKAIISNLAASAAFALASQADTIVAGNRAVRVGSVGIVATFFVSEDEVTVTSRQAPKKAPDVTTEAGKAIVREELDAIHDIFVEAISVGRDTTVEKVNAQFGQGATLLADEALKRGMIDSIAGSPLRVVKFNKSSAAESGGNNLETKDMNLAELKAENPEAYEAAVKQGVLQERDRVGAHLTLGAASGDMETAVKAVIDGTAMTETIRATYQAASMRKSEIAARGGEEEEIDTAAAAAAAEEVSEGSEAVASAVEAAMGVTAEA